MKRLNNLLKAIWPLLLIILLVFICVKSILYSVDQNDLDAHDNSVGSIPDEMLISAIDSDDMTFEEAFRKARIEMGPLNYFEWHGRLYSTLYGEELKLIPKNAKLPKPPKLGVDATNKEIQRIVKNLYQANSAFIVPDSIMLDEGAPVKLLIKPFATRGDFKQIINKTLNDKSSIYGTPQVLIDTIIYSNIMEASLYAPSFEVTSMNTSPKKIIDPSKETEWNWFIIPKKEGRNFIHLDLNAHIKLHNDAGTITIQALDQFVLVYVSTWDRFWIQMGKITEKTSTLEKVFSCAMGAGGLYGFAQFITGVFRRKSKSTSKKKAEVD